MNKKRIFRIIPFIILTLFLYLFSNQITQKVLTLSNSIKSIYLDQKNHIYSLILQHFNQAQTIKTLQQQVKELEPKASLSVAFASKLNSLLHDLNMTSYDLELKPVQFLSYSNINNPNRIYLEFPGYDESKQYGLIYKGVVAGIVKSRASKPVGVLLPERDVIFSVLIGNDNIEGVAYGDGEFLKAKFIPLYKNPQIGDEVITSGYDKLFYHGIKVGKVIKIQETPMYKIAIIKPFVTPKKPQFLYAVDVK